MDVSRIKSVAKNVATQMATLNLFKLHMKRVKIECIRGVGGYFIYFFPPYIPEKRKMAFLLNYFNRLRVAIWVATKMATQLPTMCSKGISCK